MKRPQWTNPSADALMVSGTLDRLAIEHVRDRLGRALDACTGLRHVATIGAYAVSEDHVMFEGADDVGVVLKPFSDSLVVDVSAPSLGLRLKMPPERSGTPLSDDGVPAAMIRLALACMDAHPIRSSFSLGAVDDGRELIDGLKPDQRTKVLDALWTACALIAAANPDRSPNAVVRILLPNPSREARIVDSRSSPLFRKAVERRLSKDLPSVLGLSASTHGHVDFEPMQVSMLQKDAGLDAMSIMRLVAASGIDPHDAVLTAAMAA